MMPEEPAFSESCNMIDYSTLSTNGSDIVDVKKNGSKTVDGASEIGPWSEPLPEVLELILGRLSLADHLSMSRVCKIWSSTIQKTPPYIGSVYGLPCLASISRDGKTCILVDPFCNELHIKCKNLPSPCMILYSKGGWWLLMLHSLDKGNQIRSIFFFNPLTNTRIDLPNIKFKYKICAFAFSTPPTSPDCIVIAIRPFYEVDVDIHIFRRGDKEWTDIMEKENEFPFEMSHVSPVFCKRSFYCLGDNGRLGVYDIKRNFWSVMSNPKPMQHVSSRVKELYITEFDGELIMIFASRLGDVVQIDMLDRSTSQWKAINTIGDRSVFVGRMSSTCSKADALAKSCIYFPRTKNGAFMFYNCKESKFSSRGNFHGSHVFRLRYWMEPQWFQSSSEKQINWSE